MICRLWIIGEIKASQPSDVRNPAAFLVPALMTANAASYSGTPSFKAPCAAFIIAAATSPAFRMISISSGDLIIRIDARILDASANCAFG